LFGESIDQSFEITSGTGQVGLGDLDIVETDDGIHGEGSNAGTLSYHLPMDLAVGRDIDDDVGADEGGAPQPLPLTQRALSVIVDLGGAGLRKPVGSGFDPWPAPYHHLASAADAPSSANRVQVDSEGAGSIQDRGAVRERSSPP
jgi:hypothetical protein